MTTESAKRAKDTHSCLVAVIRPDGEIVLYKGNEYAHPVTLTKHEVFETYARNFKQIGNIDPSTPEGEEKIVGLMTRGLANGLYWSIPKKDTPEALFILSKIFAERIRKLYPARNN